MRKELFDSIATQNAEIRTVAKSLPLFLKQFAKSLFFNRLSQTDKNLKYERTLLCNSDIDSWAWG